MLNITSREWALILAWTMACAAISTVIMLLSDAENYLTLASRGMAFVAIFLAGHTTFARTKLSDLYEPDYLNVRELRRLESIIDDRRRRLTLLAAYYIVLAIFNGAAQWLAHIFSQYSLIAGLGLTLNLLMIVSAVISQFEIWEAERFKSRIITRHKQREDRRRQLDGLNGGHA